MRPIDVYLSIRPPSSRAPAPRGFPVRRSPHELPDSAPTPVSLLGYAFAFPATDLPSPGDAAFHDASPASADRPASALECSSNTHRTIEPLTPLSHSATRRRWSTSVFPTDESWAAETSASSSVVKTPRRFPGPERLPPARTLLGPSSAHATGATRCMPTHDVLSPATRARCLAAPRATRELRSPATRRPPPD